MRRILPFAIGCVCLAQAPTPVLSFNKVHHDFGRIHADRKVSYRFKATNTGGAPLQIKQVVPSCGCTYTLVGQWYLKPGESTEIEATFNPAGMRGAVRKTMQIVSEDPVNPAITLSFEADVVQEIMPSTTALFFDDVLRSAPRKATLRLASGNGQPVQILDAKAPGAPYLSASFRSEGRDVTVEVALDGSKVRPMQQSGVDTLTIRTRSERMPIIPISIQWALRPTITTSPAKIAWAEVAGKNLRATLTLKHADGKPFRVLSAKPSHSLLQVEGVGKVAAIKQELTVTFGAKAKAGSYNEHILFTLDDPDQPELDVRLSAILR